MIFGREPAAIVAAIQSLLVLAVSFGWLDVIGLQSQNDVAAVVLVVSTLGGIYLAWATSETLLAPVIEFFKAALGLAAIYGLTLTTEQTGMAIAAITAIFGIVHRTQTSPLTQGTFARAA